MLVGRIGKHASKQLLRNAKIDLTVNPHVTIDERISYSPSDFSSIVSRESSITSTHEKDSLKSLSETSEMII